jgi:acetyltransferase-like isoleucine patch superfamily enzyme
MFYSRIINSLYHCFFRLIFKSKFKKFGHQSRFLFPLKIDGIKNITIGNNVYIAPKSWLAALQLTGEKECDLIIGDGSNIGHFNHIYATKSIIIGKKVLTADKVYISDNLHSYENINIPIIDQPIKQISTVEIGEGSWLGEHVCVIGAKIGKNCVIGANSVVTRDIPDYCVAVGAPARVIKRYCLNSNEWLKTDEEGNYI